MQKGIMHILKERNFWSNMEGAVMGVVFFLSVQKTQTGLGATQTLKESLSAGHVVCWQLDRTSKSKKVDYRKRWGAVDSWLSLSRVPL